ncbi:MAG: hypothetical protein WEB93_02400 [Sphingomonadales bacterium]
MIDSDRQATIREAVGVFQTADALENAIDELEQSGFDHAEMSLLASEASVDAKLGHRYDRVRQIEDDPEVPRRAYIARESVGDAEGGLIGGLFYVGAVAAAGAIVASGGTLVAVIGGTLLAGGAGGAVGAVLARVVGRHHASYFQQQLDRGGILLWVRTRDAAHEVRALEILGHYAVDDVHVHDIQA